MLVALAGTAVHAATPAEPTSLAEPPAGTAAGSLPDDAALEAAGATIGRIDIIVEEIFEQRPGREWNAIYRAANRLHATTDRETIEAQLLFRQGEPYLRRALDETARILRGRRYFRDATVVPVRHNADNTVDVEVRAHDVWTLSPGISFGRSGGENRTSVELKDSNLFGWGKTVALERASNVDRTSWLFNYDDTNLFGSWWHLRLDYADSSDGHLHGVVLEQPFYALRTPWSAGIAVLEGQSTVSRYDRGEIIDQFRIDREVYDIYGGFMRGVRDGWISRWLGGFQYDRSTFGTLSVPLAGPLPADRLLAYPWVGMEWLEDRFQTASNLNQIGRTEDLDLGRTLRITAGYADPVFGADRSAVTLAARATAGFALGEDRYLLNALRYSGRVENGELRDSRLGVDSSFYLRHSESRVLFVGVSGEFGAELDADRQALLGGDTGLRGYPLRYRSGSSRAVVTVEQRFYTRWRPLELFQVGAAVFFDAGRTWGHDAVASSTGEILKDVGVGLRFGSLRSGLGNVIHVDVAVPLDREPGIDSVQLLVETKRSF